MLSPRPKRLPTHPHNPISNEIVETREKGKEIANAIKEATEVTKNREEEINLYSTPKDVLHQLIRRAHTLIRESDREREREEAKRIPK